MFDLIKYSSIYCKMDCEMPMDGYEVFRKWISEHTRLCIDHYITIPPLAPDFTLKSGCYNNVFQIRGVLRQYITRAVVGGKCMTANIKMYHVKKKITYVDACSLYPSAVYYMDAFLEGLPNALTNLSYESLKQQDGYCISIKTIRLHKHSNFPLPSKIDEDGVRNFTHDMDSQIKFTDKTGLEDL